MAACIDGTQVDFVVDYPTVEITAELRLNGAPFSTQPANSVGIWLMQDNLLQRLIAESHLAPEPVRIVAGTYDLLYANLMQTDPTLPQNLLAIFQEGLVIDSDGVVVVDIPSVEIGGEVTLNGAPFPTSPVTEGEVYALRHDGLSQVLLGSTIGGDVSSTPIGAVLIAGTYDIVYRNILSAAVVPMNTNAVVATMEYSSNDPAVAIDIVSHDVTGDFLVNGALAPPSPVANGSIELRRTSPRGLEDIVELGETMSQSFARRAIAGTYDAHYFRIVAAGVVPRNTHSVAQAGITVDGSSTDIDIPSVEYEGDFLIDGAPPPVSPVERGDVYFLDRVTGAETLIGDTNDQSFSFPAIPGTYDVIYRHVDGGNFVPQNEFGVITRDQSFPPSGTPVQIPIAMNTTESTIAFSLDDDTWAPAAGIADLTLLNADGSISLVLGASSAIPFTRRLISAPYRVRYQYVSGNFIPVNINTTLPQTQTPGGAVDTIHFNVPSLPVRPSAWVNGSPFPNPESASLSFRKSGSTVVTFGTSNGFWGGKRVMQGNYDIRYSYSTGDTIPQNSSHQQNCIDVEICFMCSDFEAFFR